MEPTDRIVKTDRGVAELRERGRGYSQKIRMVLFLADGSRTAAEIAAQLPAVPEAALILDALVREGLVAAIPQRSVHPVPANDAASVDEDIRRAIIGLSRYLHDALGPDADALTERIESAESRSEFAQAVRRAISTLQNALGQSQANQFQARAQAILDTYFKI